MFFSLSFFFRCLNECFVLPFEKSTIIDLVTWVAQLKINIVLSFVRNISTSCLPFFPSLFRNVFLIKILLSLRLNCLLIDSFQFFFPSSNQRYKILARVRIKMNLLIIVQSFLPLSIYFFSFSFTNTMRQKLRNENLINEINVQKLN